MVSKVDEIVPHTKHVNLGIVREPSGLRAGSIRVSLLLPWHVSGCGVRVRTLGFRDWGLGFRV